MDDKVIQYAGTPGDAIGALRSLMAEDGFGGLAIAKTAVKEGTKGLIARGISVLQHWAEAKFFEAFVNELEDMRKAGKIRDDFNRTDAGVSSLREFFEMIGGKPDESRFRAFCALFMSANAPDANSSEAILDIELMGILKQLTAGEMHLLSAFLKIRSYTVVTGGAPVQAIAKQLGYKPTALIAKNVKALMEHRLIESDSWNNQGGSGGQIKQWLTDLGEALADKIARYEEFKLAQSVSAQSNAAAAI